MVCCSLDGVADFPLRCFAWVFALSLLCMTDCVLCVFDLVVLFDCVCRVALLHHHGRKVVSRPGEEEGKGVCQASFDARNGLFTSSFVIRMGGESAKQFLEPEMAASQMAY